MSVTFKIKAADAHGSRLDPRFHSPQFAQNIDCIRRHKCRELKELCDLSDETWDRSLLFQEAFPYVEIGSINCENGQVGQIVELPTADAPSRAQMIVRSGDLLVSATRPTRNAIAFVPDYIEMAIASTGFLVVRTIAEDLIDRRYLFHALRLSFCTKQFDQYSSGGNYPAITREDFRRMIVPLPPLPAQQKIVAELDAAYAAKRTADEKAAKLLASIDNMVLKELGIAKLPKPDTSLSSRIFIASAADVNNGRFDSHYYSPCFGKNDNRIHAAGALRLGDVVALSHQQWDQKCWLDNDGATFPYIEIGAVSVVDGEIDRVEDVEIEKAPSRAKMLVEKGDLLVSLTRPTRRAIAFAPEKAVASTGFAVIRKFSRDILPAYLFSVLRSELCAYQFDQRSTGGNYPAITEEQLLKCVIPKASIALQERIASKASTIRAEARKLKADAAAALEAAKRKIEARIVG